MYRFTIPTHIMLYRPIMSCCGIQELEDFYSSCKEDKLLQSATMIQLLDSIWPKSLHVVRDELFKVLVNAADS